MATLSLCVMFTAERACAYTVQPCIYARECVLVGCIAMRFSFSRCYVVSKHHKSIHCCCLPDMHHLLRHDANVTSAIVKIYRSAVLPAMLSEQPKLLRQVLQLSEMIPGVSG